MKRTYEDSRIFMNTTINIKVVSSLGTTQTYNVLEKAYSRFREVVNKYSRFEKSSELSKLNRSNKEYKASDELFSLVKSAIEISKDSNYVFDPTIIDFLEKYGYKKNSNIHNLKSEEIQKSLTNRPKVSQIILDAKKKTITLKPNQRLDLGSIAKGYAVDLAARELSKLEGFIINAGGDVYASGKNEKGNKWQIGLRIPNKDNEIFGRINLDKQALASSGNWAIKYKEFAHILNPNSGKKSDIVQQAFVIHNEAKFADAYATMLFLMGSKGLEKLKNKKIGGLVIKNNKIYTNKYFPNF